MALRRPRHWNPVKVTIRAIDVDATRYDPVFKVPGNRKVRGTEYTYDAQVNLGMKAQDKKERVATGDHTDTTGHLVLRTYDLAPNSALPKPQKGWLIVGLYVDTPSEMAVDYLIEEVRHESPKAGEPLLIYVPFIENLEKARTP